MKYFFKALRFILGKIFNAKNVTFPLKLISKIVLGTDFKSNEEKLKQVDPQNLKVLESAWMLSQQTPGHTTKHFSKFAQVRRIFKTFLMIVVGLASALALMMLKKRKDNDLDNKREADLRQARAN